MVRKLLKDNGATNRFVVEFVTLELLAASNVPIGNARLAYSLSQEGIEVSEATAGRILRDLDRADLTQVIGKRGRVITEHGQSRLEEIRSQRALAEQSSRIVEAASPGSISELMDLLQVRRLVEPEAAKIAAMRATEEDIILLLNALERHELSASDGHRRVDPALDFHRILIRSCHNLILMEMGTMLLQPENDTIANLLDSVSLDPSIAYITEAESQSSALDFAHDHQIVAFAIRDRNPEAAEHAMRGHFDKLIARVERYVSRKRASQWETTQ
jgi:GntR family transcriptional regulator, transcriptional repressor for pyruvate dehydrogenase complex